MQPRSERPLLLQLKYHEVTYDSTFEDDVMLTGNLVSLLMGAIICFTISMIWPEDYDFQSMREIRLVPSEDGDDDDDSLGFTKVRLPTFEVACARQLLEVRGPVLSMQASWCRPVASSEAFLDLQDGQDSPEAMEAALNFVLKWGGLLAVILIPIWPLLALPAGVFSEGGLTCCGGESSIPVRSVHTICEQS